MKSNTPYFTQISIAWKKAWTFKSFRVQSIITLISISSFTIIFPFFFDFIESRNGSMLKDYVLDVLPSHDVSWIVFFFLYSGIFAGVYYHLIHPKTILLAFQTYILVTIMRMITITWWPLEPPTGYTPLREPFVQLFTTDGKIISKDLFFSGHMSTILSLYFATHRKYIKTFLLLCCFMIGTMVLIQHVHYTIDVLFAVPATYGVYYLCKRYLAGKSY